MEVTTVVLHKGALAHYTVVKNDDKLYIAHLVRYGGDSRNKPPKHFHFIEEGRHCSGSTNEQDLMDDLCYNTKQQLGGHNAPQQNSPKRS